MQRLPAPTDLYPKQQKLFVPLAVPRDTPVYLRLEFSKAFSNGFTSRHPQGVLTNLTFCATNTESCGKPEIGEARWWLHGNISNLGVTGAQYSLEVGRARVQLVPADAEAHPACAALPVVCCFIDCTAVATSS